MRIGPPTALTGRHPGIKFLLGLLDGRMAGLAFRFVIGLMPVNSLVRLGTLQRPCDKLGAN